MKRTAIIPILLTLLLTTGCAETTPAPAIEDQLAVLTKRLNTLETDIDWLSYTSSVQYAVTDLNDNGLLELVVSSMQGTGHFTFSYYYEVNEDATGVTEWTQTDDGSFSQPDIGNTEVPVYIDADGVRHYIFNDYIRNGYAENSTTRYAVVYSGGQIEYTLLAGCYAVYNDEKQDFDATYTDAGGDEITEEDFNAIADTVFAGLEQHRAHIGWTAYASPASSDQLQASYAAFAVD